MGVRVYLRVNAEMISENTLALLESYKLTGSVSMVEDSMNEELAHAAVTNGFAIGNGSDAAFETADAVLFNILE